jgi:hypothetical protein
MAIPNGFAEVWFRWELAGDPQPMYTHIGYSPSGPITQSAVDAGFLAWQTAWRAEVVPATVLIGGHILVGDSEGAVRFDSAVPPLAGTASGNQVVQNTAVLCRKLTGVGGRRNRGRMFGPAPLEDHVSSDGVMSATGREAWRVNFEALLPGGAIHTAFGFLDDPVLFHDTGSQTPTPITDLIVDLRVATQRRRLRR